MAHRRLKKIVPVILSATSIMLVGCNSGTTSDSPNQNNSANIAATNSGSTASTQAAKLSSSNITTSSSSTSNDSCVKATFQQTQSSNKLTTNLILNNSCNYDITIGGYKVNFSSEYIDDTSAPIESLNFSYVNPTGKTRNQSLKLSTNRYLCPNGNGTAEMLSGTFGAKKIKAGSSLTFAATTNLTNGKVYDTQLAKSTFRILTPNSTLQNDLGISLTDPESYNYAMQESNKNKGRDSLSSIPLYNLGEKQFGLKTVMITNNTCGNMESAIPPLTLPSGISVDKIRTTCKLDGTQILNTEQSCKYVLRYDPSESDIARAYESIVSVDVYAKTTGNNVVARSNTFNVPYSTRGKITGKQTILNQLSLVDNKVTANGLTKVSIGYFGLQTFTIRNNSSLVMESVNFSYAPNAFGLPSALAYDMTRTTCKVDGSQQLTAGQSCVLAIKYTPKIQLVSESPTIQVIAYQKNSNKEIAYTSSKFKLDYSTNVNNTPSILSTSTDYINGFDIDDVPSVTYRDSLKNIKRGSFGLKAFTITNDTGETMYNVNLVNRSTLNDIPVLKIDTTRTTCKFNLTSDYNKFNLADGQSCSLVLKYSPTDANLYNVDYDLAISGYDASGAKIQSDVIKLIGNYK